MENDSRKVFAINLKYQMDVNRKTRKDISDALGVSYFTISDWVNGKKYPRMDKVELLASYFGIQKSDLIEVRSEDDKNSPDEPKLNEGEELLLQLFRQIPDDAQKMYLEVLRAALKNQSQD